MKGSRLAEGSVSGTSSGGVGPFISSGISDSLTGVGSGGNNDRSKVRAKTASSSSVTTTSNTGLKELSLQVRPPSHRPGHPVSLISFPSNTSTTPAIPSGSKVFGPISVLQPSEEEKLLGRPEEEEVITREIAGGSGGGLDEWNSQKFSQLANLNFIRVPKPSQSAKKLAKTSTTILLPSPSTNANTNLSYFSGGMMETSSDRIKSGIRGDLPFVSDYSYYTKPHLRNHMHYSTIFLGQEQQQREENSPSASSNNIIDNKIGNKPRRNKTANANITTTTTPIGLRKGLTTATPPLKSKGFRGNKKVDNSAGSSSAENLMGGHEQQSSLKNTRVMTCSGTRGRNDPPAMANILSNGNGNGNKSNAGVVSISSITKGSSGGGGKLMSKFNERLQVNRTQEERDESPESIRLDGLALKAFPFIGGGEGPYLKLLSLQHNLITRLENVPSQLNHLIVLDLYDNRLERITGLQGFTSLRVLLLGKNRIRRIEGLDGLKRLEILDLHGNQLRYVDNLGALSSLRILNLAGNLLRSVRNLGPYGLSSLTELNLKRNRIRNLDGLVKAPHLKKLLLANNDLQSFGCLFPLRKLVFLQELLLEPNPLCSEVEWKSQVLTVFPWLITLDRSCITDLMRLEARQWHKRKLAEDEERRKEEARLRAGSPTGGPPGSREQAIYQARRRWESVKNFVKNTNSSSKPTNPSSPICEEGMADTSAVGIMRNKNEEDDGSRALEEDENDVGCTCTQKTLLTTTKSTPIIINEDSKELLEYPGGEVRLNLAQLDLDLDQASKESILVAVGLLPASSQPSSLVVSSSVVPGDPCPPSRMINDLKPTHQGEDYVNSDSTANRTNNLDATATASSTVGNSFEAKLGLSSEAGSSKNSTGTKALVISSSSTQTGKAGRMDTDSGAEARITKMGQKAHSKESFPSPRCQQTKGDDSSSRKNVSDGQRNESWQQERYDEEEDGMDMVRRSGGDDDDEDGGMAFIQETSSSVLEHVGSMEKSMRIAVVRPLVRESNFDETFPTHQLNTNLSPSTNNTTSAIATTATTTTSSVVSLLRGSRQEVIPSPYLQSDLPPPPHGTIGHVSSTSESIRSSSTANHHNELKKSTCNNNEDQIKWVSRGSNDLCDMIDNDIDDDKDNDKDKDDNDKESMSQSTSHFPLVSVLVGQTQIELKEMDLFKSEKVSFGSESKNAFTSVDVGGGVGSEKEDCDSVNKKSSMKMTMSDADFDKIINSSKKESMGFSNHKKRNVSQLRRSVSTCLMPSELQDKDGEVGEISCATFNHGINVGAKTETTTTVGTGGPDGILCIKSNKEETTYESENMNMNKRESGGGSGDGESKAVVGMKAVETEVDHVTQSVVVTTKITNSNRKPQLRSLRSASFDGRLPSSSLASPLPLLPPQQQPHLLQLPPPPVVPRRVQPFESDDDYYYDDDDTCSIATSTNTNTTNGTGSADVSPRSRPPAFFMRNKQLFPRTKSQRQRLREKIPRVQSSSSVTSRKAGQTSQRSSETGRSNRQQQQQMRRCDSAVVTGSGGIGGTSSSSGPSTGGEHLGSNNSSVPLKKQGTDYLVEIDGKVLSIYGQGALKHTLTGFPGNATCTVTTAKFHYISYDSIIPYFGKLRQIYPSLEHFQFRANNISTLSQLNALSDLQGLTSLHVAKEGNPLVSHDSSWLHYASYRLSHWGLQNVNGKEVSSEYRGGQNQTAYSKCFESLGFLALSCLPQTALTPLAKRLHMLHCFCCCSPSSSSDDSGGKGKPIKGQGNGNTSAASTNGRPGSPSEQPSTSSGNICTSWDDDPVLLDVIGKEALVYCPPPLRRALSPPTMMEESNLQRKDESTNLNKNEMSDGRRRDTLRGIVDSGVEILEKLDLLEKTWPSLMTEIIQEVLMDYMFMDNYMKKELKKCQDAASIALHSGGGGGGGSSSSYSSSNKKSNNHHHNHKHH